MANTKISQLPSWSGTAADLRWFVMNNSGESETFKFSGWTSPYKLVGNTNIAPNYFTGSMGNTNGYNTIINGNNHSISSNVFQSLIAGGDNNDITGDVYRAVILGGNSNYIQGDNDVQILGGGGNYSNGGYFSTIINGADNRFNGNYSSRSIIAGGYDNLMNNADDSTIIGGQSNSMTDSNYSAIFNSSNSSISNKNYALMLGISGRTALYSETTHVENSHAFRTYSTSVQAETTGTTFTCDLNNGGKAQFFITNAATINITNVRDGQSFSIKTQTNGNYSVTWTSTGYTFKFSDGGVQNPGNSTIDIFEFEVFGNVIYGNRKHNYT